MTTDITPFLFDGEALVRVILHQDEPWFVAADVCAVLDHGNPRQVVSRLDDDDKGVQIVDTLGGPQEMTIINESGLYTLILTSRKPAAKRFKKWVTSDVLPSIRRTGGYGAAPVRKQSSDVRMSFDHYSTMTVSCVDAQNEVVRLNDLRKQHKVEAARILFRQTDLTDEAIAHEMRDILGEYAPEWVSFQRRKMMEEATAPV